MKKYIVWATLITALIVFPVGWCLGNLFGLPFFLENNALISPLTTTKIQEKKLPLLKYSIDNLQNYDYQSSLITIEKILEETPDYTSYLFSYQTLGKTMTGQLNIPTIAQPKDGFPIIVMLRGFIPEETYITGAGTKSAAAVFAKNGYVTLAPDFFGFGKSDPETEDSWEARFQKPLSVIELIKSIEQNSHIKIEQQLMKLNPQQLGIWAHSNGGQIALTVLEILEQPIPTTLWAPVTAPFPYSILFFSDENDDEGKKMRKWLSLFEEDYDMFEFSLTQHLDKLSGPIQIHQGTADDAVPVAWNDEFVEKIKDENNHRKELLEQIKTSTQSGELETPLPPIKINYFKYPGANHNLQPSWDKAIQRDLVFFIEESLN